jgi:high-affinity iron transporter
MAVTKEIKGSKKLILLGILFGVFGSFILALFTDKISQSLDGIGQEIFNGAILFCAAAMISWTVIWMQKHAKSLSGEMKNLSNSIKSGKKPLYSLLVVVFLSVLREGSEIVLFSYSSYISGVAMAKIITGLVLGVMLGIAVGVALYFGILKIFGKYFFKATTWILVFLACGIMAQAFGFWVSAGIIPSIIDQVWDSSKFLSQQSNFGNFLHIFIGYIDQPSAIQVVAYLANLTILFFGLKMSQKKHS